MFLLWFLWWVCHILTYAALSIKLLFIPNLFGCRLIIWDEVFPSSLFGYHCQEKQIGWVSALKYANLVNIILFFDSICARHLVVSGIITRICRKLMEYSKPGNILCFYSFYFYPLSQFERYIASKTAPCYRRRA